MRIENPVSKLHEQIHTQFIFFLRQRSFFFFPARMATRKINLGVGVLVQDPMIVMTLCVFAAVAQGQGRHTGSFRVP